MLMFIFVFVLVAGVIGFFMHARGPANGMGYGGGRGGSTGGWSGGGATTSQQGGQAPSPYGSAYGSPYGSANGSGYGDDESGYAEAGYGGQSYGRSYGRSYGQNYGQSAADAEAEARHWMDLLGAGLTQLDGAGEKAAVESLSEAAERDTSARRQLAEAQTAKQFELAGRSAREGLHYLRAARIALGRDPGPELGPEVESVQGTRQVTVEGQEYVASGRPGDRTPYYYPGGMVQGRMVPSGWYSTPWWKTALLVGGAGIGSMVLIDALFGGMHHGGFGGGPFDGGFGGGFGDGGFGGGPF